MPVSTAPNEVLHLMVSVPPDIAMHIRSQVSSGVYASESEYVESMLLSEALFEPVDDHKPSRDNELSHWMNTEGGRRLEALHADPASGLTLDQAFDGLTEDGAEVEESA